MTAVLLSEPRWSAAARALVSGCVDLRHEEDAVALLQVICRALGDELYPSFLRVLCEVGRCGDHGARAAVAQTLVTALRTGRLPSGRLQAWGGGSHLRMSPARSLGPLEYLCAWAGQADGLAEQQQRDFLSSAEAVMVLVEAHDEARALYCEKLHAESVDPLEGALSRAARNGISAMATAWAGGAPAAEAAQRFIAALSIDGRQPTWRSHGALSVR